MTSGVMEPAHTTGNNGAMSGPIVLISTAMAVSSRFYAPLVDAFAERGWDAMALPRRGFERGLPVASRDVDWGYDDEISDIADAVAKAGPRTPSARSSSWGTAWAHSSAPAISCTMTRPTDSCASPHPCRTRSTSRTPASP